MMISEARSKYWDQRLYNWALWVVGGAAVSISACDVVFMDGAPMPPPPLVGDALDTDDLVLKLEAKPFMAVRAWYVWTGSVAFRASELGCDVDTLRYRVKKAKETLDELDAERRRHLVKPPKAKGALGSSVLVLQIR